MRSRWPVIAALILTACQSGTSDRRARAAPAAGSAARADEGAAERAAPGAPAPSGGLDLGTGVAPGATAASCAPVTPFQRAGTATVMVHGDGIDVPMTRGPAVCGALHTSATRRFTPGDGTLYRACLPDGSSFAISADIELPGGKVDPTFKYEAYKKTGPLLEYTRPGVGTYNQRDPIGDGDVLTLGYEHESADATIVLAWPSKPDRQLMVTAQFTCPPP